VENFRIRILQKGPDPTGSATLGAKLEMGEEIRVKGSLDWTGGRG